jgi:hypothetical protein
MTSLLFPYPTMPDAEVTLSIAAARLDGVNRPQLIKKDDGTVPLYADSKPWKKAELDVELTCDPMALRAFEDEHGPVRAVLVADCSPTSIRQPVDLSRSDVDVGRWSGTLELERDNVQDRVYLVTTLSATVAGVANRRVGAAPSWTVYADEPESLRLRGTLQVKWLDFGGTNAPPPARDFPKSTHVIAFTGGVPELWLNSGFEGLEALLKDRKDRRSVERGLHDFQRAGIARGAWMALLADALSAVTSDSDDEKTEPAWPEKQWQTEVLKLILPEVAPGKSERELLKMAGGEWQDSPGAGEFFSRAEAVIGDIVKANESLRRFVHSYRGEEP